MKLKFEVFLKNEYIVRAGTKGNRMFFLKTGAVEVIVDGKVAAMLSDGSHFGEICLLTDDRRVADIVTVKTTDVFSLSKRNFDLLLNEYPDMRRAFENIAMKRLNNIGRKASLQEIPHLPKIRPPPSIIINNSSTSTSTSTTGCAGALEVPIERNSFVVDTKTVRRLKSEPVANNTTLSTSCVSPRSFSETGSCKQKLPPLSKVKKAGWPSDSNPNMIIYPSSDDSDGENCI